MACHTLRELELGIGLRRVLPNSETSSSVIRFSRRMSRVEYADHVAMEKRVTAAAG